MMVSVVAVVSIGIAIVSQVAVSMVGMGIAVVVPVEGMPISMVVESISISISCRLSISSRLSISRPLAIVESIAIGIGVGMDGVVAIDHGGISMVAIGNVAGLSISSRGGIS